MVSDGTVTEKAEEPQTESSRSSPLSCSPMSTNPLLNSWFNRINGFSNWRKESTEHSSQRVFRRDVEKEEFQYASTHCLSSYYSVFVVRLAIMGMLAILIGMLTLLTWHFTKIYTTKSLNSLAYGLRYELLQRPVLRMWSILNSTSEITKTQVKFTEYVIRRYDKPTSQAEQIELYEAMKALTWGLFASHRALFAITINYKNGFVQAFHRDLRSSNTFYIYSDLANYSISTTETYEIDSLAARQGWHDRAIHGNLSAIWYRQPLDPTTGEKTGKARPIPPDDLINIAGLTQVPDGAASWHVTVSKYTDSPLLSAALPVWDPSNKSIVAVVGVTTALYSVGQLMKELVEYHSGHIYLTSQEGYLLATSTNGPLLTNTSKGPELMMPTDFEDSIIRLGAEWLKSKYGDKFPLTQEVHAENVKLGREKYYIDSFFLKLKRLPLVGVIIIPRKYIMGKVDERTFKTLLILISASLCILVIGCVCILILTNGVSKEMRLRAELISQLDARRRAEASSNYKSQFLANMSHELRTPMAAVIGLLDILISDDCLTNEQYSTVTQIRKCSTALLRLLNNILDLSKVESGKLVLEDAEFDLGRELEGIIDMFSVQCINHNVETVLDLSDDMPKLVQGDSARVVQIFANLISNSIKFTSTGHIIVRGWCEHLSSATDARKFALDQKKMRSAQKIKVKQHGNHAKKEPEKDNKMILWFEIDDTGCGIDPTKWDTVFESFEQADPSTTRTYGGTGLGLCIVRTLVKKMGGEIKIVKKEGPGTLMQLFLVLSAPGDNGQHCQVDCGKNGLVVLLALQGNMSRSVSSEWLQKNGVFSLEASEWNELTQILRQLFSAIDARNEDDTGFDVHYSVNESLRRKLLNIEEMRNPAFIILVDIGLLDSRTDLWKEQLNFLNKYSGKAKFAWMLNHDTSNNIKMDLRRKGHVLMVNKPLYKAKMVHILEAVIKERNLELRKNSMNVPGNMCPERDLLDCLDNDPAQFDTASSDDSDMGSSSNSVGTFHSRERAERTAKSCSASQCQTIKNCLVDLGSEFSKDDDSESPCQKKFNLHNVQDAQQEWKSSGPAQCDQTNRQRDIGRQSIGGNKSYSIEARDEKKSLGGVHILLAEDTPVLQRVATIMLEKMGATVVAVGDGQQAVDALNFMCSAEDRSESHITESTNGNSQTEIFTSPTYDLILMDCQMPRMDGYEATKAIRKKEVGTGLHIPIVALTAHAMSSDETKCLEVGMDSYLTKPIDYKLMVSTILSLTKRPT